MRNNACQLLEQYIVLSQGKTIPWKVGLMYFLKLTSTFFLGRVSLATVSQAQDIVTIAFHTMRSGMPWPPVPWEDQGPSFQLMAAVVFHASFFCSWLYAPPSRSPSLKLLFVVLAFAIFTSCGLFSLFSSNKNIV